ncbi:hypothetical protein VaNZ11_000827 [Volvox africanus]|uniref:Uncharacterized protein n=1 Tax=Volvox africanus TaxID=51714 RepID=A0ABQ5RN98_9CHLO|nr:hypothetical protein VaNZ11_000827 [Volvox africanus]
MDDWSGEGRGSYRGRPSGGFGGGGGRYNDNYYRGRGGRAGGGYYDGSGPGGYYDGPQGARGGRGGSRGGYQDYYQAGSYQGGGGYDGGGYRGGGGRFNDGGSRRGFRGGRTWNNAGQKRQQQQQQQYNSNPPPNLALLKTIQAHTGAITCLSYDQATNALYSGSKDGKIKQWDCNSGQVVHEENLNGQVTAILFVQGFLFVAYVKGQGRDQDGIINVYNTAAGKTQMIPGHRGYINQLMVANNLLFSCGQDNSIRVWGMEGEAFVCKQILDKDKGGHTSPVHSFEMINGFLVSGDSSGTLKIWDSSTGSCTQTLPMAHAHIITSILQYGNNILSGSSDSTMKVWELTNPPMPGAVVKPEPIDSYFTDDGASRGGGRYRQGGVPNAILTMDGSPDNKGESMLAIATIKTGVSLYNVDQGMTLLGTLPRVDVVRAITNVPGAAIILGDDNGQVHIFSWSG